ncbi:hypothetical protein AAK899_07550 [Erysipelotrichaceae bacterium 51-3]
MIPEASWKAILDALRSSADCSSISHQPFSEDFWPLAEVIQNSGLSRVV